MSFFEVLRSEAKLIFSDIAIVLTIIGGVILYSFLYPQPYANESVTSLRVSVVDLDRSDLSRDLIFMLDATPQIDIVRSDLSEDDAKAALISGDIKGIIVIPKNFKKDIYQNRSATIAVGADASYFLVYGGIVEAASQAALTQSAKIKVAKLLKESGVLEGAKKEYTPFSFRIINLFNKNNSYIEYVVPAVFILILQQTLLIGLGILGGGVNESLRSRRLKYFVNADIYQIITARFIIFGGIFFIHMLFYFGYSFSLYSVVHIANIYELLNFGVAFLAASIGLGIFLGSLFTSREIATPAILFSSLPLVFAAGFVWPKEAMPEIINYIALLFPSTPAIQGFLKLNQMGAEFNMVLDNYITLWIQALLYTILGYYFIYRQRKKYGKI